MTGWLQAAAANTARTMAHQNSPPLPDANPVASLGEMIRQRKAAIRQSPRAVVYVGCPVTTYSVRARELFLTAAPDIASDGAQDGVALFVIEAETAEDSQAWAAAFHDERLAMLGHLGYGWVLWLEGGQIREVEPHAGYPGRSPRDIVQRTRVVWP